jgi:hypothetical protein
VDEVHRLIIEYGRERTREMLPARQYSLIDTAAEALADDAQNLGITYSGFCLTGFPHKRLGNAEVWEKRGHNVTLLVEPGRLKMGPGPAVVYGVPYGARARMILIYLQTQAVRTGSPQVRLGRSMRDWMGRMGMSVGGETARAAGPGAPDFGVLDQVLLDQHGPRGPGRRRLRARVHYP